MNWTTLLALLAVNSPLAGKADAGPQDPQKPGAVQKPDEKKPEPKHEDAYEKAVKDHSKKDGVFRVWRNKESVLYDVPRPMLGRDFLWITEIKQTPHGGYNGTAVVDRVVRWEELGDKVLLRTVNYRVRATDGQAIKVAVEQSNVAPIVQAFDVKAKAPDGALLIDVGRFVKSDIAEFTVKGELGAQMLDSSRTFLDSVLAFPTNVNVTVLMTFVAGQQPRPSFFGGGGDGGPSKTALVSHSMTLLPEVPMQGRVWDSRVGYFASNVEDYADRYQGVKAYKFINRYRLEKKDPGAMISEPVKPIVYYVAPEVPEKWRPYVKKGVEDWQPAFEQAGFANAIVCRDAPSKADDPDWSPEDARYSVIRWAPLPVANAMGPSVADPRSGEIISAHIIMWHDVLKLCSNWYFAQASPLDPRARSAIFPDELLGELLRFVVAHEVGHTLGLPHNGKSSSTVPVSLLRDPKWTRENGTATSIMDYARFNYVAQPGDGAWLIPLVGKYDKFAIEWGYKPIPGASGPFAEQSTLDRWAARQADDPQLRFYDNFSGSDPSAQSESLGSNAVDASTLGVANLKRIIGFLERATTKLGEDYSDLSRFYDATIQQFMMYVMHVSAVVGGVENIDWHAGRGGNVFNHVPATYQRSAVTWLTANVFEPPAYLVPASISLKLGADGGVNRLQGFQQTAVNSLLNDARLHRMLQNERLYGSSAYRALDLLAAMRVNVWRELGAKSPKVDLLRRNLQRVFVNGLARKLGNASSEIKALATGELETAAGRIGAAIPRTSDAATSAHLKELLRHIRFALANPDKLSSGGAAPITFPLLDSAGCALCDGLDAPVRSRWCDFAGLSGHLRNHRF